MNVNDSQSIKFSINENESNQKNKLESKTTLSKNKNSKFLNKAATISLLFLTTGAAIAIAYFWKVKSLTSKNNPSFNDLDSLKKQKQLIDPISTAPLKNLSSKAHNYGVDKLSKNQLTSPFKIAPPSYLKIAPPSYRLTETVTDEIDSKEQMQKGVASNRFSEKTYALATDDKALLHLLGDFFGKNTGLEGFNDINALKLHRNLLSELIATQGKSDHLQKMIKSLDKAIEISEVLHENPHAIYLDVCPLRNKLNISLGELKPNESIFLTGGWVGNPNGHTMVYEIIKQTDRLFSFRLYNTGSGIEYHLSQTPHLKEKIMSFVEFTDIPLDNILERPFLNAWKTMVTKSHNEHPWNADDIYQTLITHLGGKPKEIQYSPEDLLTPQRSGTCSFMSLQTFFYHMNLEKTVSQKTRFNLLSLGINHYVDENRHRLAVEPQAQNLFSKSLEEYSRITIDLYKKNILNKEELNKADKQINEFHKILKEGKQTYQQSIQNKVETLDLNKGMLSLDREVSPYEKFIPPNESNLNPSQAVASKKSPLMHLPSLKEWEPKKETLIHDFNSFLEAFKKGTKEKSHLSVQLEIQAFVQKLNIVDIEFSKEEIVEIIRQLNSLGFLYYENIQRSCKQHPDSHCQMTAPNTFLTMNTILHKAVTIFEKIYHDKKQMPLEDTLTLEDILNLEYTLTTILANDYFFTTLGFDDFGEKHHTERVLPNPYIQFMDPRLDQQFLEILKRPDLNIFITDKYQQKNKVAYVSERIYYRAGVLNQYFIKNAEEQLPPGINEYEYPFLKLFDKASFQDYKIENKRVYFPPEFYHLRDLSLLSLGLEKLPISLTSLTSDHPLHIETQARFRHHNGELYLDAQSLFPPMNPLDNEYPEGIANGYLAHYHLHNLFPKFEDPLFKEIIKTKKDEIEHPNRHMRQNSYFMDDPRLLEKNTYDYFKEKSDSLVSLQKFRDLISLATSKELLIKETLSYFSRNPELLIKSDYQVLFKNLMFTPGLLLNELKKKNGDYIVNHLAEISVHHFKSYKDIGDLKTALFFLQMNRLFEAYATYAEVKPTTTDFLNTREEARKLLAQKGLEKDIRWLLNKELALSYSHEKTLTPDQAQELLSAAFTVNSYFDVGYHNEKWDRLQMEEMLQKHTDAFIQLTKTHNLNDILNQLFSIGVGSPVNKQWKADPAYPYFKAINGEEQIDLVSCIANSEKEHGLPREIASHPHVLKIFQDNPPKTAKKVEKNAYLVTFEGNSYRLFQNDQEIIVQREFLENGKRVWGRLLEPEGKIIKSLPTFLPPSLLKTSRLWILKTSRLWIYGKEPVILLATNQKDQIIMRSADVYGWMHQVDSLTGKNTGLVTLYDSENKKTFPILEMFSAFEDKGYFTAWVDEKTKSLEQLDFSRLGPSGVIFKRQKTGKKDRMVSDSFPGFYLAERQYLEEFQDDRAFLLLENDAGEQQVVLMKQYFKEGIFSSRKAQSKVLMTSEDYLERELNTPHLARQSFYQYKVNRKTGKLETSSLEASFYLSLRYLWKMRYEDAESLIRRFDSFLRPYSPKEAEILEKIAEFESFAGDQDPRATALSLYAGYLLEKNSLDFHTPKPSKSNISNLYSTYLNQLNNIYGVRMTKDEERLLIGLIPEKNQAIVNRLIELDPIKGKQAQAHLSQKLDDLQPIKETFGMQKHRLVSPEELEKSIQHTHNYGSNQKELSKFNYKNNEDENVSTALRKGIAFQDIFSINKLLKENKIGQDSKEIFKSFTGLDFIPGINWKKELISSLRMMTSTPYKESRTLAWILLGAVEHPEAIQLEGFTNWRNSELLRSFYKETIIPKLKSLYPELADHGSSPQEIPQAKHPSKSAAITPKRSSFNPLNGFTNFHNQAHAMLQGLFGKKEPLFPERLAKVDIPLPGEKYEHCVALEKPSSIKLPYFDKVQTSFSSKKEGDKRFSNSLASLQQTFSSVPSMDPVVNQEMKRIEKSIHLYREEIQKNEGIFSLTSLNDLTYYSKNLSGMLMNAQQVLRDQEMDLLKRVNRPSKDIFEKYQDNILNIGQSREPLTIDDVIRLYWNRDSTLFHRENPHLSVDEIHQLILDTQAMLVQGTHVQQIKRVLKQIELIQKDPKSQELQENLKLLKNFVEGSHLYEIDKHPEYLVLEYYADILLRQEQVQNLDLLQIRNGKIQNKQHLGTALEMIMGSGKTTVLMPLLGIFNADGDNLSIGILPSALLPSMSDMLAKRLGTSFKQMVEVVDIKRETAIDEFFLMRLESIRTRKKFMLITESSMQSLNLNFIEFLHRYSESSKPERQQLDSSLQRFQKVFGLLKGHSSVIIDEVDQILNPRTEKQYTLGDAESIPAQEIELISTLYEALESDPKIANILRFEFSPDSKIPSKEEQKTKQPFMQKTYEEKIKPKLIDLMIQKGMGVKDKEFHLFFKSLTNTQKLLIKDYLSIQSKESLAFVSKQTSRVKDLLALAKEEIQNLLPLTCIKLSNQNYGPDSKSDFAIPFHGSDTPAIKSQFGTPYETINYTFQLLIKQGINKKTIAREIDVLRKKAIEELKENREKLLEETSAYQKFLKIVGGDKTIVMFGQETTIDQVQNKVNQSLQLKLQFIRTYIAPQIKSYQKTISANPQIYNYLFSSLNAFTGTQWNADTFPEGLNIVSDEIITGKTLGLLWKNREQPIQMIQSGPVKTMIENLLAANPQAKKANALIDTAGIIRGISRKEVASQLLHIFDNRRPDVKGIIFYNTENELMILEKGKETAITLASSKLQPGECFTFYDQKHTTGSDIKQIPQAMAIVTIGRHTLLRDLLQSVWRLRGLDKSQQVQFSVDEEVKELIFNTLKEMGISVAEPLKLEQLLLFASYNQAQLQGDNNFRSLKHKTWEVLQREMFTAFLDPKLDGNQLALLFQSLGQLFIQETTLKPWELFGEPASLVDSATAAEDQIKKVKESPAFQTVSKISSKQEIIKELDRLVEKTIPLLPKQILKNQAIYGREVEAETERETEKEQEKELEVQTELENSIEIKKYNHNTDFPFKLVELSDGFKATKGLESFSNVFDSDLYASLNLLPINGEEFHDSYCYKYAEYPPFGVFNQYQKTVCGLRIISEDRVVMVDQIDARDFESEKDEKQDLDAFYDLNLGLWRANGEVPAYLTTPKFLRKVVQAKFFNGETYYKKEEIPALRSWIREKGAKQLRTLFVDHILKFKDESRITFPNSILDKELKSALFL